jgi:hypothetical protein
MAGKKPAKPMSNQAVKQVVLDPAIYGSLIKLYGSKDALCKCGTCAKKIVSGMVREKNNIFYCSIVCVKTSN